MMRLIPLPLTVKYGGKATNRRVISQAHRKRRIVRKRGFKHITLELETCTSPRIPKFVVLQKGIGNHVSNGTNEAIYYQPAQAIAFFIWIS